MAKFCGIVGYVETREKEDQPGVWEPVITERTYMGDVTQMANSWNTSTETTNDDFMPNNQISVVADPFAYQNFRFIRYVEFMGAKWKVTKATVQRPRLVLTVGGVYNGPQT